MRVVITGPTGTIGHALINLLLSNGDEVLAICHKNSSRISSLPKDSRLKVLELDLSEYSNFALNKNEEYGKYDCFYHFAWHGTVGKDRLDAFMQTKNIMYSLDAVELAKFFGCDTFIGAGSQAEYGRVEGKLNSLTPVNPESGYGIAKLCSGQMTRMKCNQIGMRHIWVRILSIYGPYDGEKSMIISSLRKMIKGEETSFTKGEQEWDYLYCSDAANALYLLGIKGKNGKTYVIGSGQTKRIADYIKIMQRETKCSSIIKMGEIPYSPQQVMYLCADIKELIEDVGFSPRVSFEDGIRKTIEYIKGTNS